MIEEKDIVEAIPKTLQDNIFDLTQFILGKKIDQARDLVRDLTLQGEDEIKLIAVMLGQFSNLYPGENFIRYWSDGIADRKQSGNLLGAQS